MRKNNLMTLKISQVLFFILAFFIQIKVHAWEVDMSRRQDDIQRLKNIRMPASVMTVDPQINKQNEDKASIEVIEAIKRAVSIPEPAKDIIIAQTETGFIPETLNLQKGQVYQIHIVNLNSKEKNVSFLMDSFSQSHNTIFGQMKSFKMTPNVEGVFSFQSPETGASGQVVVVEDKLRKIATAEKE